MQHREVALQVHGDHRVPLRFLHAGDERVAQDAGVVDQHVEPAELVDRLLTTLSAPLQVAMSSVLATAVPPAA